MYPSKIRKIGIRNWNWLLMSQSSQDNKDREVSLISNHGSYVCQSGNNIENIITSNLTSGKSVLPTESTI